MPHLDDGQMHGYLDGECSASERHLLERHVEDCEACRTLLEEAAATQSLATQLLGELVPEVSTPEWQDMLERAGEVAPVAPPSQRAWRRDLAWAATLVLAFALGWQASRGFTPDTPNLVGEARLAEPVADDPPERIPQATTLVTPQPAAAAGEVADEDAVARPARRAERAAAPTPRSVVAPPANAVAERRRAPGRRQALTASASIAPPPSEAESTVVAGDLSASRELAAIDLLAGEDWLGAPPLQVAGNNPVGLSVGPGGGLPDASRGRPVLWQRYVLGGDVELTLAQQYIGSMGAESIDLDISDAVARQQGLAAVPREEGGAAVGLENAVFSVRPDGARMLRWRDRRGYLVWLRGNADEADLRRLAATLRQ